MRRLGFPLELKGEDAIVFKQSGVTSRCFRRSGAFSRVIRRSDLNHVTLSSRVEKTFVFMAQMKVLMLVLLDKLLGRCLTFRLRT